jgi:trk system potassium uptake protein TrkA
MEAKQMNADLRTVARIETTDDEEYLEFVDDVVFPEEAGAHVAANQIVGSDVVTLSEVTGRVNILEIRIAEAAPVAGRTLEEISMPDGSQVVSDSEGGTIARAETVLQPGRRYIFAAEPAVVDDVMNLVRG